MWGRGGERGPDQCVGVGVAGVRGEAASARRIDALGAARMGRGRGVERGRAAGRVKRCCNDHGGGGFMADMKRRERKKAYREVRGFTIRTLTVTMPTPQLLSNVYTCSFRRMVHTRHTTAAETSPAHGPRAKITTGIGAKKRELDSFPPF